MMKTKCFGLRPITGAGSDQANAADVDSPDAAPVVPVTSRDVSQPECAEIQEWQLENQGGGGDMEACNRVAHKADAGS